MSLHKVRANWLLLAIFLIVLCNLGVIETKRSFGIGRSRPKASSPNVRRRAHTPVETPRQSTPQRTANVPASNHPVGPPPSYSASGNVPKTNLNGAPPAYSPSQNGPPSYSAATGIGNANYPRQTYTGSNGYHGAPPSYGANNFGHSPYAGAGAGYGGYPGSAGMGGVGMGGMGMGGMGMGGGYQQRSSSPFGFGNILTGLAVWQLARGFGGGHNTQHIYHHHTNQEQTSATGVNSQPAVHAPSADSVNNNATDAVYYPPPIPAQCIENCTDININGQSETVTPIPDTDYQFPYSTIHPSLFPYGRSSESLEYWATSHSKILNTSASLPDTTVSTLLSTTTIS